MNLLSSRKWEMGEGKIITCTRFFVPLHFASLPQISLAFFRFPHIFPSLSEESLWEAKSFYKSGYTANTPRNSFTLPTFRYNQERHRERKRHPLPSLSRRGCTRIRCTSRRASCRRVCGCMSSATCRAATWRGCRGVRGECRSVLCSDWCFSVERIRELDPLSLAVRILAWLESQVSIRTFLIIQLTFSLSFS